MHHAAALCFAHLLIRAHSRLTFVFPYAKAQIMPARRENSIFLNVRLGAGAPAIGIPFFWLSSAMPNTVIDEWSDMVFLKLNGATFSAANYQQLALMVPSLRLPDTRGEFLRIWDDGRGIDSGRGLLSFQAATSFTQYAGNYDVGSGHAIGNHDGIVDYSAGFSRFPYPGPAVGDGVNHVTVRPRNIAFNFLVRAK